MADGGIPPTCTTHYCLPGWALEDNITLQEIARRRGSEDRKIGPSETFIYSNPQQEIKSHELLPILPDRLRTEFKDCSPLEKIDRFRDQPLDGQFTGEQALEYLKWASDTKEDYFYKDEEETYDEAVTRWTRMIRRCSALPMLGLEEFQRPREVEEARAAEQPGPEPPPDAAGDQKEDEPPPPPGIDWSTILFIGGLVLLAAVGVTGLVVAVRALARVRRAAQLARPLAKQVAGARPGAAGAPAGAPEQLVITEPAGPLRPGEAVRLLDRVVRGGGVDARGETAIAQLQAPSHNVLRVGKIVPKPQPPRHACTLRVGERTIEAEVTFLNASQTGLTDPQWEGLTAIGRKSVRLTDNHLREMRSTGTVIAPIPGMSGPPPTPRRTKLLILEAGEKQIAISPKDYPDALKFLIETRANSLIQEGNYFLGHPAASQLHEILTFLGGRLRQENQALLREFPVLMRGEITLPRPYWERLAMVTETEFQTNARLTRLELEERRNLLFDALSKARTEQTTVAGYKADEIAELFLLLFLL